MSRYVIRDNGVPVEGTYTNLNKAMKQAKRYWLRRNPDEEYHQLGFEHKWDGAESLWIDDGSSAYHSGITVERA